MAEIPADDVGGMYYALPLSIITVEVPITKIERKKGDCFDESDKFCQKLMEERLGKKWKTDLVDKWSSANEFTYTFYKLHDKEITLATRPAPDRDKVYYATLKGKWNRNQQLALTLNELGQMTKGEFVNENRTFDLVVQGVSSLAGVVSTIAGSRAAAPAVGAAAASKDTTTLDWQIAHYSDVTRRCFDQKKNLLLVRKARFDFTQSASNSGDVALYNRKLAEFDNQDQGLMAGLTYEEERTKAILRFDVLVPTPASFVSSDIDAALARKPLFAFNKESGVEILAKPSSGSYENEHLIHFGRQTETISRGYKVYYLTFDFKAGTQVADRTYVPQNGSRTRAGIAYNIPALVRGRVQAISNEIAESPVAVAMLPLPQLGRVAYLPERASKVGVELDPLTGALRTVSLQQTGLSVDQIKAAGEAASAGTTALKKPAAKTELEKIQSDNSLLEQQIKRIKQQRTLDSLSTGSSRGSQ